MNVHSSSYLNSVFSAGREKLDRSKGLGTILFLLDEINNLGVCCYVAHDSCLFGSNVQMI
jgi:hypothetical protein